MALMEDTGWYLPNYDMADELKWGRNLGCDFVLRCTLISCRLCVFIYALIRNSQKSAR